MKPVDRIDVSTIMDRPGVARLLAVCRAGGATARFVGGAVRDVLLGRPLGDIDIAIDRPPAEIVAILTSAGIETLGYGFSHGTVPALLDGEVIELTSLRVDVKALGRHAEVAFTDDWAEDARRRDLTINALYLDADGCLYDPCDGYADLKAGRIRFVGDAAERIAEDRLRILRFFRFLAWYGQDEPDASALAACRAAAPEIAHLSGERIQAEMCKLLRAADPLAVLILMRDWDVLARVVPGAPDLERLAGLIAREAEAQAAPDAIRRLAALLSDLGDTEALSRRWRLSRAAADRLVAAVRPAAPATAAIGGGDARLLLYHCGRVTALDLALLWSTARLAACVQGEAIPVFPLAGRDVVAAGVGPGKAVGRILGDLEKTWRDGGFVLDRADLLVLLDRRVGEAKKPR